jgi:hypothetical protein
MERAPNAQMGAEGVGQACAPRGAATRATAPAPPAGLPKCSRALKPVATTIYAPARQDPPASSPPGTPPGLAWGKSWRTSRAAGRAAPFAYESPATPSTRASVTA